MLYFFFTFIKIFPLFFCDFIIVIGPVDPARDIETLNEEEIDTEFAGDSEYDGAEQRSIALSANTSIPIFNPIDSGSEDYRFSSG